MTSWSRRLQAANQRPVLGASARGPRDGVLADAVDAAVIEDDVAALRALAGVARERVGFRTVLRVTTEEGTEVDFEVVHGEAGPVVRRLGGTTVSETTTSGEQSPIQRMLTDTLVETPDLVAVFASVGHEAQWANDAFATMIAVRSVDKVWLVELLDEWSKGHYEVKVLPALVKYGRWRGRLTLVSGDEDVPVSAVVVAHRDRRGEIEAVTLVARDLRRLGVDVADTPALDDVAARYTALVENAADIIAVCEPSGIVQYASPATTRILGLGEGALAGRNLLQLVDGPDRPEDLLALARPDEQGVGIPVDLVLRADDGTARHLEVIVTDLTDNPVIGGVVLNGRDVTDRVQTAQELAERAFTDPLTGLANRVRLLDRLGAALGEAAAGVVVLDLDRFDALNEREGREFGDAVMQTTAHRLAEGVEPPAFLARHSGDQFVIVDPGSGEVASAVRLANRLRLALGAPVRVGDVAAEVTASAGVLIAPQGSDPEAVLRDVHRALAAAKDAGGDRVEVFNEQMAEVVSRRLVIEEQLRHALDHDGIEVHYQPIVDVATRDTVAAEALLRVHDDEGALLSPAQFIEAAESTGLITRLGSQVLTATAGQLAAWGNQGRDGAPWEVSVNISPRQLADPELPNLVVDALGSAGVPAERLCLEITESILISRQATIDAGISYLRALGVRIGLDDFGAGQSSLGYLKRFPLDFVKIDRSLIAGLGSDEQDTAIVRATIDLGHNLGLQVIAVGVETDEQHAILELLGCDRAQGYLYAPPVAAADFSGIARPAD